MHTPGPWEYRNRMVIGGDRAEYICEVSGAASNAAHQADARLIAAAPDLLEALEWVEAQAQEAHDWDDLQCFVDDPETRAEFEDEYNVRKKIRAAIAKAKTPQT